MFFNAWDKKPDEELMKSAQRGEKRALTELYNRYSSKMVRYFHRMLWEDESKAQDFLHDLFVKIIENPGYFDQQRKFSTWLYSVAFNMCKNEYRKQSFRKGVQSRLIRSAVIGINQPSPDDLEFQRRLETLLGQSGEDDRNLFVLRYELDLPVSEIALTMDCPEGTIKSRLFYFKKKLTNQLQVFNPAINQ